MERKSREGDWPIRRPSSSSQTRIPYNYSESTLGNEHIIADDAPVLPQIRRPDNGNRTFFESATPQNQTEVDLRNTLNEQPDTVPELTDAMFAPINTQYGRTVGSRPSMHSRHSSRLSEDELFTRLSRRRTSSIRQSYMSKEEVQEEAEINAEIEELMSQMFGEKRRAHSEDEKTRHTGVVFRNLTVKGLGLGAALQPTLGDTFMDLPRLIQNVARNGIAALRTKPAIRTILNDFTGCVKPGEMCLVLGRPGSGCSTFLKVLANQRFGFEDISGNVTYGGTDAKEMAKHFRGEVIYTPEDDLHYATLSVQNTLKFALKTRTPNQASRNEGETRKQYVNEFLRVVSKLFWIEHTMKTKVGDAFIRGVSGGEKKRVSIAEAMVTRASTQCWDNSTKGLDASTALEYGQSLRVLTNMARISTFISLYQAGENLYELFDKVLVIDEGRCLYYGPTEEATQYFENLGFVKNPRWTSADFLTSVSDPHGRELREGYESRVPRTAEDFERAYRHSTAFRDNLHDIETFERESETQRRERLTVSAKAAKKEMNFNLSFNQQVVACTKRQFLVMIGDPMTLYGKWGGVLFQALIVGSLFYALPKTSNGVFTRGGCLFVMLLFNALLALAELTSAFSSRAILLKHKSFSFYRPSAYAIAQTMVDIPLVLVQVSIFALVVYFMADFARTASQFFINLLFLWIMTMNMYSFFRAIGSFCGSLDIATRITGVAIQVLVVYTGYLIPPTKMHPWFKWLIWLNPVQYGFEAIMANEFHNLKLECAPPNLVPLGPGTSPQYQSCTIQGAGPGNPTIDGDAYIKIAYNYSRSHLWRNFGIITGLWLFFVLMTAVGMELQKPNAGGGAVTIFKRGEAPESAVKAIEEDQAPSDEEKATGPRTEKVIDDSASSGSDLRPIETGMVKNEAVFTFKNVNYTIPYGDGERKLLDDIQGYVKPGKLTALMGSSGAGKTTLLNTLAQRINFGVVTGDFEVDGKSLPKSFQRATGFAEQMDVHEPTTTIREAFQFSALLRQPKEVPIEEKYEYCERIIDLLEMRDIAGATIGNIGQGLNQEQRKRVTIGVELASKPKLLFFLDEPTSGLDSGAAFNIVRFLRKLADSGQALLVTIHQPSSVLFEYFDELLLLKSGGRVVYHGELGRDSRKLIDYFERNGAHKCPSSANPAEYMLEAIGAGDPNYKGQDWGDVWTKSPEREHQTEEIDRLVESRLGAAHAGGDDDSREFAMPLATQISAVVRRSFISYWRTPDYMSGKFALHIICGLFNAFTFYHIGEEAIDMQSRLFSIFMTLTISPPLIQQLQPKFLQLRDIYKSREGKAKIYSWWAFTIGAILPEIPYSLVAGTIYFQCWWWPALGRGSTMFQNAFTWMLLMMFELYYVGFGQAIAAFSPNELLASLFVPLFFLFIVAFCGIVVPYVALITFWRSWMYYATPFRYLLAGFLSVATHGRKVVCGDNEFARFSPPPGQTCESYTSAFIAQAGGYVRNGTNGLCEFCQYANGDEFAATFNVFYSDKWFDFGIFWIFVGFNFVAVFICTWLYLGGLKTLMGSGKGKVGGGKKHKIPRIHVEIRR